MNTLIQFTWQHFLLVNLHSSQVFSSTLIYRAIGNNQLLIICFGDESLMKFQAPPSFFFFIFVFTKSLRRFLRTLKVQSIEKCSGAYKLSIMINALLKFANFKFILKWISKLCKTGYKNLDLFSSFMLLFWYCERNVNTT